VCGVSVPDRYRSILDILSKYADQPIEEIRRFVQSNADKIEEIVDVIAGEKAITVTHHVTFSIPDELSVELHAEMDRVKNS
jgi:hypothetical protein